jgi:hypothetical protein
MGDVQNVMVLRGSFARPADTTQYSANDLVAGSTSVIAGNTLEIPNAVQHPGEAFRLDVVRLRKTSISLTAASFRIHLFRALPTWTVGDNGAGGAITALAVTSLSDHAGYVDITMDSASATASGSAYGKANPSTGAITVSPVVGTSIFVAIQALSTYTPASAETFSVGLEGIRS